MNKKQTQNIAIAVVLIVTATIVGLLLSNQSSNETEPIEKTTYDRIKENGIIVVGIDEAFPPITFRDEDGNFVGSDIEFAKEAGKRMDLEVEFKPVAWDSIIPALINEDIDIVWSGMGITDERKEQIDFVKYSKGKKGVAFVLENSDIMNAEDLKDKTIAVQSGSYQETDLLDGEIIEKDSWKEVSSFATLPEALLDLSIGRVDTVISGETSALYYIENNLKDKGFRSVDIGYDTSYSGIGLRKGDDMLKKELEKVVNEIIEDGTASKITEKWLGVDKYEDWN